MCAPALGLLGKKSAASVGVLTTRDTPSSTVIPARAALSPRLGLLAANESEARSERPWGNSFLMWTLWVCVYMVHLVSVVLWVYCATRDSL